MKNVGQKVLILILICVAAVAAIACGGSSAETGFAAIQQPADPGPSQVKLGDGPAGIAGSRFTDPDVEINLTAGAFQWEILDGESVELWGYNQQYPGPLIRATEGDKVRVNLTNNLPEATTIHWHGMEVPNDQDGVPGITQADIQPGDSWTYEFIAPKPGTTMYHTHSNTMVQLSRGMFGAFVVGPRGGLPEYDREYTLLLHETAGLFTINGHSFPKTLEDDLLKIKSGERILIRMINVGQLHHPMHLHGHQFKAVQQDGNPLTNPLLVNTQDIAPGQTVDVEVSGTNPGTWVFHCHVIGHVTNRGVYPGGMLIALDYEDHTSYMEEQAAAK